jgi:large subunit ribosomal protein L10
LTDWTEARVLPPGRTGTGNRRSTTLDGVTAGLKCNPAGRERKFLTALVDERAHVERAEKQEFVTAMRSTFQANAAVIVAHYAGLTVSDMQSLRKQARQAGVSVQVAKNRLAKIALDGTEVASIASLLKGPTLLAYSTDPVAAAKVATDYAKVNEKLVVLGGAMGSTSLDPKGVKMLASLPSLDELRARLVGLIQAPATKLAQLANAPAAKLARVFAAYGEKDKAA